MIRPGGRAAAAARQRRLDQHHVAVAGVHQPAGEAVERVRRNRIDDVIAPSTSTSYPRAAISGGRRFSGRTVEHLQSLATRRGIRAPAARASRRAPCARFRPAVPARCRARRGRRGSRAPGSPRCAGCCARIPRHRVRHIDRRRESHRLGPRFRSRQHHRHRAFSAKAASHWRRVPSDAADARPRAP